jgi:photosystem II stability/assembly factor-like uncharacterized protein
MKRVISKYGLSSFLLTVFAIVNSLSFGQWDNVSSFPGSSQNYKLHFINSDTGFVSVKGVDLWDGGRIFRTLDAGDVGSIYDFSFANDSVGYAIGDFQLLKTEDCGDTWTYINQINLVLNFEGSYQVEFVNQDTGFIVVPIDFSSIGNGSHELLMTVDGGANWTLEQTFTGRVQLQKQDDWLGLLAFHEKTYSELNIATLDWTIYNIPMTSVFGFEPSESLMYMIGMVKTNSTIYFYGTVNSTDGVVTFFDGSVWQSNSYAGKSLNEIFFVNDTTAFASGAFYQTMFSTDSTMTWSFDDGATQFLDIQMFSDTTGYAISENAIFKKNNSNSYSNFVSAEPIGLTLPIFSNEVLFVYPNPVKDRLYFSMSGRKITELSVFSLDGKEVLNQKLLDQNSVDVSHLTSGIYLVKIHSDEGTFSTKILIN